MKQPTSQILYNYWDSVRGERLAPTRFEIEPSRMAKILSETFILERSEAGRYPFRLAGTRLCEHFGHELRNRDFLDLFGDEAHVVSGALEAVTFEGAGLLMEFEAWTADGRSAVFETLVLPLLHPAHDVTRYLGSVSAIEPPAWLGAEPLLDLMLTAHHLLWPSGEPISPPSNDDRQSPFVPELAAARIVRFNRRQFRILDGGRKP
ncbi:MAG: PAS domain-containing protein [Proteobacteria bacterium]|nr:PAS domain-containing protein [Pseudomonadota bacterium]